MNWWVVESILLASQVGAAAARGFSMAVKNDELQAIQRQHSSVAIEPCYLRHLLGLHGSHLPGGHDTKNWGKNDVVGTGLSVRNENERLPGQLAMSKRSLRRWLPLDGHHRMVTK